MPEHIFPQVDRVVYGKAPLVEVLCQVRFPADLRIETTPPADFQQRVRGQFPILSQQSHAVLSAIPPELAKALEAVMPTTTNSTIWQFSTEDGSNSLQLQKDTLTLVSRSYRRWEEFHSLFSDSLTALRELYTPAFFTRIGLRYRDIIQRSKLGLVDAKWVDLLKPHILAEIGQHGFEDKTVEAARTLVLRLPERGAKVRLQHGFAEIDGTPETAYLIDCDFFVDRTEANDANGVLEYFHGNAASYFRWCITDQLHRAMDPQPAAT